MKLTYNWLKDFVEIKISPQELADKLTMAGLEVVSLEKFEDDWVLEVEVTTNRPDWLSVMGVAREISAITGRKFKPLSLKLKPKDFSISKLPLEIKIEDKKGCLRYVGRVIENVKINPSPSWMQKRLMAVGLRPINNIVDITNYCLLETGQPLHAFDYEKIEGRIIIVRRAREGETIFTLDGEMRKLDPSMLVIADKEKPIAIAGVMGGKDTEISASTRTILLESAYFDPLTIRKTSQKLALTTESSYRFERKVNLATVLEASLRALDLIKEIAHPQEGKILVSKIKDIGRKEKKSKSVSLDIQRINRFLGKEISSSEIEKILKNLGFSLKKKKDLWEVNPPPFRQDIEIEEDLIEEIARIHGYDKFPLTLPEYKKIPSLIIDESFKEVKKIIYETLLSLGFNEVITYSLIGKNSLEKVNLFEEKEWVKISNPLSKEQEFLRPTLLPSLLEVISYNFKHQLEDLKIFEWGKIYLKKDLPKEIPYLGICLSGEPFLGWLKKREKFSFYDLKGVVEKIFEQLGIEDGDFLKKECLYLESGYSLEVKIKDSFVGFLGRVKEEIQKRFDLEKEIFWAELDLEKIVQFFSLDKKYKKFSRFPFILRDISFIVDEEITYQELEGFFKEFSPSLIKEIKIIDIYRGENIPLGKKSLTFSLKFQSEERTLQDEEVEEIVHKIRQALVERFSAKLR